MTVVSLLIIALDAGFFRQAFITYLEGRFGRPIRIEGELQLRLWSLHPGVSAQQVTIGNPPWAGPGEFARIGQVELRYAPPGLFHGLVLEGISLRATILHLQRDEAGEANWQRVDPRSSAPSERVPLIVQLSATDVHLIIDDRHRHLQFDGTVSVSGADAANSSSRLHIVGHGDLNGRPTELEFTGDPLSTARNGAYVFDFSERSGGSRADMHATLPQPFDFSVLDGTFEATGDDLENLYYLTGLTLLQTGNYRLAGTIQRRGDSTRFDRLTLKTGQSDLMGSFSSVLEQRAGEARSLVRGTLEAGTLRLKDFGGKTPNGAENGPPSGAVSGTHNDVVNVTRNRAGDGPHNGTVVGGRAVLADAPLDVDVLRRNDTLLQFDARHIDAGRLTLQSVSGQLKVDQGVMTIDPLRGELLQGRFEARIGLDAAQAAPKAGLSVTLDGVQLASLQREPNDAPLEGSMHARIDLTAQGGSLRALAAAAGGTVTATLPHGEIRESLAELTGVDLRGLGLTLTRSKRVTEVRCAAARFTARDGTLTAQSLFIDAVPVLIRGEGAVHLATGALDIAFHGEPKDVRLLRLNTPVLVGGTVTHPSFTIRARESQVKLVDPGRGKDVDCAAELAPSRPIDGPLRTL